MRVEINIHADNFNHFVPALSRVRARIPMVMGGAGAGKSVAVAQILILSRVVTEGQSGIALRKYETDVRKSIFPLMKWVINQFGLAKYFRINKTRMHFQFIPNGAEVYCLGVSDPESLKSITVEKGSLNWAWLEEANQFKINDFREIQRRIRGISAYPKQFWMTFNPVSKLNWLKKELIDKNEPGIELFKFTYKDNVFLSQDDKEILENLAQTSPHDYRIYTLGEWGEPSSGLVFPHYEVITQSVWDALPKDVDTIFGIDWGYNAPTAVAEYKILKENTGLPSVFARQILYQTGLVTDDIIRVIKPLVTGKYVYCDGAEPDRIAQLREVGIWAKPWDKDVLTSIDFCKRLKLFVLGKDFENELENYRWLENTDKVDPKSEDHLIDTFRGAVWTHLRNHFAYRLLPLSYK